MRNLCLTKMVIRTLSIRIGELTMRKRDKCLLRASIGQSGYTME